MNKLWRRNTGKSLLTSYENLGQVQCQVNCKAANAIIHCPLIFILIVVVSLWSFTYCYGDIVTSSICKEQLVSDIHVGIHCILITSRHGSATK